MNSFVGKLFEKSEKSIILYDKNIVKGNSPFIGVRIPKVRKIANDIIKSDEINLFFQEYDGVYFEEKIIKGIIISSKEDLFNKYVLDYIKTLDSWCLVDTFCNSCKFIGNNKDKYWEFVKNLIKSDKVFVIRTGYVLMLNYYLDDKYIDEVINISCENYDFYYVSMAIAWLISEAYIKYPEKIIELLRNRKLNDFVHEKVIDKINDSFRVSLEDKRFLRGLK